MQKNEESLSDKKEKSLDKSEMEKKENVGINSETRQIGVLKGFDEQDCFKINYTKILYTKIQKWRLAKMDQFKKKFEIGSLKGIRSFNFSWNKTASFYLCWPIKSREIFKKFLRKFGLLENHIF